MLLIDRRAIAVALIACLAACGADETPIEMEASTEPQWATLDGRAPLIIAHRGASGHRPEHTLEAYELAIDQGADFIEPDLVATKDGVLVARHDRYLSSTTNIAELDAFAERRRPDPREQAGAPRREDWWVEDFTLAELKTLKARQPRPGRSTEFDDQFDIPTFSEVLVMATRKAQELNRSVGVYPETKSPGYFSSINLPFDQRLLAALEGYDAGPVFIQSFEPDILRRLYGKTNARLVQLVYEETPGAGSNVPLDEIAQYADGVGPAKAILDGDETFVASAHALGLVVHPWTFRDDDVSERTPEQELAFYSEMGIDGMFTDFPDTAAQWRDQAGSKPVPPPSGEN